MNMLRVGAIVLCGGQSKRMGKPKAWLPIANELMRISHHPLQEDAAISGLDNDEAHLERIFQLATSDPLILLIAIV